MIQKKKKGLHIPIVHICIYGICIYIYIYITKICFSSLLQAYLTAICIICVTNENEKTKNNIMKRN